jgi:hypothetical protein
MTKTIVALYDDIAVARQVVEDLVNANFARSSISLITNDAHNQYSHYLDKDYAPKEEAVTAGEGARFGSVVGALTGLLVGAAALTIPGIGLAIAAGPIVGALTGIVAGAITGGIAGALVKSGVPEDEAPYYAEGIRRGGTLISIQTSDTLRAEDIMNRNGSTNIHERINLWRLDGWKGFGADPVENEDTAQPLPEDLSTITRNTRPITVVPVVEEEPQFDDEDTDVSLPIAVTIPATDTKVPVTAIPAALTGVPAMLVIEKESDPEDRNTGLVGY